MICAAGRLAGRRAGVWRQPDRMTRQEFTPPLTLRDGHAQDDPFIPFAPFAALAEMEHSFVTLLGQRYGGHVGFWGLPRGGKDRYWAENWAGEFCRLLASSIEGGVQNADFRNQSS